jgi:hypothetical protein
LLDHFLDDRKLLAAPPNVIVPLNVTREAAVSMQCRGDRRTRQQRKVDSDTKSQNAGCQMLTRFHSWTLLHLLA